MCVSAIVQINFIRGRGRFHCWIMSGEPIAELTCLAAVLKGNIEKTAWACGELCRSYDVASKRLSSVNFREKSIISENLIHCHLEILKNVNILQKASEKYQSSLPRVANLWPEWQAFTDYYGSHNCGLLARTTKKEESGLCIWGIYSLVGENIGSRGQEEIK